jgi:DNA-binding NtrC family response regulator
MGPAQAEAFPMPLAISQNEEKIVVLVDDELAYIDLLQQLLSEHLGCPVRGFSKPEEALRALPDLNVGLVITDYQMPAMNGMEFIHEVQKHDPGIPVVMITAYLLKFTQRELAKVPALKAVVRKPFKWKTLAEQVVKHWPDARPPAVIGGSRSPFGHR